MFAKKIRKPIYLPTDEDDSLDEEPLDDRLAKNETVDDELDKKSLYDRLTNDKASGDEPRVKIHFTLSIEGIRVEMPVRPYPCQELVIKAIIEGCRTQQHCLLESPTGSGKTLALLCGSLAWQDDHERKAYDTHKQETKLLAGKKALDDDGPLCSKGMCNETAGQCQLNDDYDLDDLDWSDDSFVNDVPSSAKFPRIFYGSRTHKQIDQVIREFRKTCYSHKNMTILSSRDITCIQDSDRDKTQLCNDLLDPTKRWGCPYYTEENKSSISSNYGLRSYNVESPWDIEDLINVGKEANACPYFAARSLMADADIVFCPYNYIIDPVIRDSMQIDIAGSIIILDEAHNIENICRDCGSVSLPIDELEAVVKDCENIVQLAAMQRQYCDLSYAKVIDKFAEKLINFITTMPLKQQINSDSSNSDQWTGTDFVSVLEISKSITLKAINDFMNAAREASSAYALAKEMLRTKVETPPTMSHEGVRIVEKALMAFKMVTTASSASDYRVIIRQILQGYKKEKSLEFMCMNPGVIFAPLCQKARTVILASGTLAPTNSYQGELGVKFPFTIQADHVTPQEQVFIKCISKGPAGKSLRATYQNVNTWDFQDDLGGVLLTVCESVPHGILMFFSSYSVMGNLLNRWKTNGMWNKLMSVKKIFQETRGNADLSTMMENYRESIRDTASGPVCGITGALLFAVFRGKVAEGIDFSDNEARCVLTVGIPYSVRNDPATDMKYQYNDLNRKKGLLSGNEWYTVQAFRALNQALGRAIRHQNDWGAIILIDERFLEVRNTNYLPAWVRTMWIRQTGMDKDLRQLLKCFVAKQIKRERGKQRIASKGSS